MRRKYCEITDPVEIGRILDSATIGRLATNGSDGYPYITPVNFVYFDGKIYFHSSPVGEKLDNLSRDSKVCFEVDIPLAYVDAGFDVQRRGCRAHQFYHCVIIRGAARVVPDGPLKVSTLNALVTKHERGTDYEAVTEEMASYKACAVIEITPVSITTKSELGQNKSPEQRLELARYLSKRNLHGDSETVVAMGLDPADL